MNKLKGILSAIKSQTMSGGKKYLLIAILAGLAYIFGHDTILEMVNLIGGVE